MRRITAEQLFEAIGETKSEYLKGILEANPKSNIFRKKQKWMFQMASAAACLTVFVVGAHALFNQITANNTYWNPGQNIITPDNSWQTSDAAEGCDSGIVMGKIVDGKYYYLELGEGIYAFDIETGTKEIIVEGDRYLCEEVINEYGIFYTIKNNVYMRVHETGETKIVFSAEENYDIHIYFDYDEEKLEEEQLEVLRIEIYNYDTDTIYERVLDGKTGEDITEQYPQIETDSMSFDEDEQRNDIRTYQIDNREFKQEIIFALEKDGIWRSTDLLYEMRDGEWELLTPHAENGEPYTTSVQFANNTMLIVMHEYYMESQLFLHSASGADMRIPSELESLWIGGVIENYIYYRTENPKGLYKPRVYDTLTGESWDLKCYEDENCEKECSEKIMDKFYDYVIDGEYAVSADAWTDKQILWKVNYDEENRPVSLSFIRQFE